MLSNTQIPKTNDSKVFETQIKTLFKHVLGDHNIQINGTSGQKQQGVDLYGYRKKDGSNNFVGVQCKQTTKSKLDKGTVKKEATDALNFKPDLKEFLIVTQASDCVVLQEEARLFTQELADQGRDFEVYIYGWGQVEALIRENAHIEVLNVFGVSSEPQLAPVLDGQQLIIKEIEDLKLAVQKTDFGSSSRENNYEIVANGGQASETQNTPLDEEIDGYRDVINDGKPKTALGLLESLWGRLPKDVDPRIRYRVKANIAACLLRLDQLPEASEMYLEAYNYAPDAPKADSHKVLSLILSEQYGEALEFGKTCLSTTQDQESLVSNTIMALKFLPEDKRDIEFIPKALEENRHVLIALIDLQRATAETNRVAWRETSYKAYQLYPEEKLIRRFYAEAILDEVFEEWDTKRGAVDLVKTAEKIRPALTILEESWQEASDAETAGDDAYLSIAANLANGYRLVDEYDKAKSILESALQKAPEDEILLEKRLMIAFETGDKVKARELLDTLPPSRDIVLGKIQILFNDGDWQGAYELELPDGFEGFNEDDSAFYESIKLLAGFKSGNIKKPKVDASALIEKYPSQVIVPITLYQMALDLNDQEWANQLYESCKSLQDNISISQRVMLAEISESIGDFKNIIEVLHGIILEDIDSLPLRLLAVAYANAPLTEQTVEFAENISDELLKDNFYACVKGSIHFKHGDVKKAEKAFYKAVSLSRDDASAHMGYLRALLRQDKQKQATHHLKTINLERLQGPNDLKMAIAQLHVVFGNAEKGIKYGYDVALSDQGSEQVSLFYVGMILPNSRTVDLPAPGDVVTNDCWVILEDKQGKKYDFVIVGHLDKPEFNHYLPSHEIAQILIGKSLGDEVTQIPLAGTKNSFKIIQIKNRYVGFLHHTMDSFSTRFAGSQKLYSYTTEEGDVQPILDDIKKMSEGAEKVLNLYIEQKLPLAFLSGFARGNVIEFANRLVDQGHIISTCIGTHQERNYGLSLCSSDDYSGAVLDTYTLWLAHVYDLIPILKGQFGRLVVPQSSIDELYEWRQSYKDHDGEPLFTIGYQDGEYIRQEIPVENLQKSYETLDLAIKYIKENIEVLPAAPPSELGQLEAEIRTSPNGQYIFDSAYIAQKEGLLLLSEDMSYRTIAKQIIGIEGVWLQAALLSSHMDEQIDIKTYSNAVHALAVQKHGHLSLSPQILLALCEEADDLQKYKTTLFFIGLPTADIQSHIGVTNDFLRILWASKLPHLTKCKASSLILERMCIMMGPHDKDLEVIVTLCRNNINPINDYIKGWIYGHYFIDING